MGQSVNRVILVGNLGQDPEIRAITGGDRIAHFRVATSERWRDRASGEWRERTEWHRVVALDDHIVRAAETILKKGSTVYLEGSLQTRKFTDRDGAERSSTEIVLRKFKSELTILSNRAAADGDDGARAPQESAKRPAEAARERETADLDDAIPF